MAQWVKDPALSWLWLWLLLWQGFNPDPGTLHAAGAAKKKKKKRTTLEVHVKIQIHGVLVRYNGISRISAALRYKFSPNSCPVGHNCA